MRSRQRRSAARTARAVTAVLALALALLAAAACGPVATPPALPGALPTGGDGPVPPASAALGEAPVGPTEAARVVRVVDGDTIIVDRGRGNERLRYIGVDSPESVKPESPVEFAGAEASRANEALVGGRQVVLETDVSEVDRFGRLLRYVWLPDGTAWRLVNLELVRAGFARVSTFPPDVRYVDLYLAAEREARDAGRGLWGPPSDGD